LQAQSFKFPPCLLMQVVDLEPEELGEQA